MDRALTEMIGIGRLQRPMARSSAGSDGIRYVGRDARLNAPALTSRRQERGGGGAGGKGGEGAPEGGKKGKGDA
jgi:hypothetical protein